MRLIDRIGERHGRLSVVERAPNASERDTNARWLCQCDCGKTSVAYGQDLKRGKVVSCGCWNEEKRVKHGLSRTHVNGVWRQMLDRCRNEKNPSYHNYGGRGIKVCQRWHDFENFLADMGHRPEGYQIDRFPDNDGDYEPSNCRWATAKQQQNNKRASLLIEHDGSRLTLEQWAEKTGLKTEAIRGRLRRGWPASRALTEPI